MKTFNVREARENLASLLDAVEAGEEVLILRRGKASAVLQKPQQKKISFPDRTAFRKSIQTAIQTGSETAAEAIRQLRDEESY